MSHHRINLIVVDRGGYVEVEREHAVNLTVSEHWTLNFCNGHSSLIRCNIQKVGTCFVKIIHVRTIIIIENPCDNPVNAGRNGICPVTFFYCCTILKAIVIRTLKNNTYMAYQVISSCNSLLIFLTPNFSS